MMLQILEFAQNHWMLSLAFLAVLVLIIIEENRNSIGGAAKISSYDLVKLLNKNEGVVLDIRDHNSFAEGHILGAIHIERNSLDSKIEQLEKHRDKKIVVTDENGNNISKIISKLQAQNFKKLSVLIGGMAAWKKAKLPLDRS